jgi:flagellum-specific peptidoglycan hydrolase FlgJ
MSPYKATLAAKTPTEQIEKLGVSGYAEAGTYGKTLMSIYNKHDLNKYNPGGGAGNGEGDGKTYMVSPKATYNKSINTGVNKTDVGRERELEAITKKVNVAVNNINTADPISYTEILKLIMQELHAINSNTAATASGVNNIEIISANTTVSDVMHSNTTTNKNKANSSRTMSRQTQTNSTGYQNARNIAGYKK